MHTYRRFRARPFFCINFLQVLGGLGFLLSQTGFAQTAEPVWKHITNSAAAKGTLVRWVTPDRGELFSLNAVAFHNAVARTPVNEPALASQVGTEIELPMPDGKTARFVVVEAPIMEPELAAKFPEIKTYAGRGIDDPEATVRLDISPAGFHAQVLSPSGAVYVDPAFKGDVQSHVSYYRRDYRRLADDFHCFGPVQKLKTAAAGTPKLAARTLSGANLRTYRLAVAATGEYTQAVGGGTVSGGLAAIVTAVNRVDGVYETELAVRLVLVANNNLIVYTDPNSDPYTNNDANALLGENQTNLDAVIGAGNYDIGHVFSTGGGGLAMLGVVCVSGYKAQGETGSSNPVGDAFYIDYVAHEMGHQFGANHTFNSETGSCTGNREPTVAYEPGSGSTIMAYAGICSPNDLQVHSDPYFHAGSLNEILTYLTTGGGGSCAVTTSTGNSAPTVSAGAAYTIPARTPFALTATASDANGDTLTYCWEEMDLGAARALTDPDNGSSPLFRSLAPTTNAMRFFPRYSSVLANTNWNQEIVPTMSRTMHFRVTARDNRAGGGGVADADTTVTIAGAAGPFVVTSPNTPVSWSGTRTVTWNVAGTAGSPVNATGVNIYLSADGGNTFPYLLATNVPNNGAATVALPNINTSKARIKVTAAGNIFYDISDVNFTVSPGAAGPLVQSVGTALVSESCTPTNGAIDPYETVTVNWSLMNVGTSATTNLTATLLATNGIYYPSVTQNYGAIVSGATVSRTFSFVPSGVCGGSVTGLVQLMDGAANMGVVAQEFQLGRQISLVTTQLFSNAGLITIQDNTQAIPYPSTLLVSGVTNQVTQVMAGLNGFSHAFPSDVGVLLVGPGGQSVVLMANCGDGSASSGLNLSFSDDAVGVLPSGALASGNYLPSDNNSGFSYASPAPSFASGTSLNSLAATPNGTWSLYVYDFLTGDSGSISGGWSLQLVSSNNFTLCCTTFPTPTFTSTTYSGGGVQFSWSAIPGPHYQVQYRTNLTTGSWVNLGSPILGTNTLITIADPATNSAARFYRVIAEP